MRLRRSNCLLFALAAWRRWGGYFAVRRTRHLVGWHWLVRHPRYDRWVAFEPMQYHATWWREAVAKLWYAGRVVRDDKPRSVNMAKGTQSVAVEFRLVENGKVVNRVVSEIPEMSPESASRLQADLLAALRAMHLEWHQQKFG